MDVLPSGTVVNRLAYLPTGAQIGPQRSRRENRRDRAASDPIGRKLRSSLPFTGEASKWGRMKDPARLSGEEEWQPFPAADEPRRVGAPERKTGASSRLLEALKLIASIAVIIISLVTMVAMFRDVPMLSG